MYQQWSHIVHARPIGTVQLTVKISITGCICSVGVNSVERGICGLRDNECVLALGTVNLLRDKLCIRD